MSRYKLEAIDPARDAVVGWDHPLPIALVRCSTGPERITMACFGPGLRGRVYVQCVDALSKAMVAYGIIPAGIVPSLGRIRRKPR